MKMGIKTLRILRWFLICWEKCEKLANKKVIGKKSLQNVEFILFYTTNLQKFLANDFLGALFLIISTDLKSA
jgi:hypothetical protein